MHIRNIPITMSALANLIIHSRTPPLLIGNVHILMHSCSTHTGQVLFYENVAVFYYFTHDLRLIIITIEWHCWHDQVILSLIRDQSFTIGQPPGWELETDSDKKCDPFLLLTWLINIYRTTVPTIIDYNIYDIAQLCRLINIYDIAQLCRAPGWRGDQPRGSGYWVDAITGW